MRYEEKSYKWIILALVVIGGIYLAYQRNPKKVQFNPNVDKVVITRD